MSDNDELLQTARSFRKAARNQRATHFRASDNLRTLHYGIGLLLIVLSAVVSGSVLQATQGNQSKPLNLTWEPLNLTWVLGALSIAVVILTSIQTTFKLGERSEQHRSAAVGFGKIRRKLDVFVHRPHSEIDKAWGELLTIVDEISSVEAGAPGFLSCTYNKAKKELLERAKEMPRSGEQGKRCL